MKIFAALDLIHNSLIIVSDKRAVVEKEVKDMENIQILETENFVLSETAKCLIFEDYEFECLRDTVANTLYEKGLEGPDEVINEITSDAQHDITKYDVDEDYAIEEAISAHRAALTCLGD